MYPHERSLVEKFKDQPFVIIGVNSDPTLEHLRRAMKENDLTWPSFFDGGGTGGPIATRWGVHAWPTVFVIDQNGVISEGGRTNFEEFIERLLKAQPGK